MKEFWIIGKISEGNVYMTSTPEMHCSKEIAMRAAEERTNNFPHQTFVVLKAITSFAADIDVMEMEWDKEDEE